MGSQGQGSLLYHVAPEVRPEPCSRGRAVTPKVSPTTFNIMRLEQATGRRDWPIRDRGRCALAPHTQCPEW